MKITNNTILIFACLLGFSLSSFAQTEKRVALVIGNSEYYKGDYLDNPVNDAEDVTSKLKMLGFDVMKYTNASLVEMDDAVSSFSEKLNNYDVALFYYSGHGVQSKGENFLIPIDAEIRSEADLKYKCFPVGLLMDKLEETSCNLKMVVLDACRNNPYTRGKYRGVQEQGLASISPPRGTFVTFSTAAGSVALDGVGRNSPYTEAFLATLEIPGLSLFDFFNNVGHRVLTATNDEQDPWSNHNTLRGDFFFNEGYLRPQYELATKQKSGTNLLPDWMSDVSGDEYVGISAPLDEPENARKNSLLSAVLQYVIYNGGAKMEMLNFQIVQNVQIEDKLKVPQSIDNNYHVVDIESSGFEIEVIDEFYNSNNEYFTRCRIVRSDKTDNRILCKQSIISTNMEKQELSYSISTLIDGKQSEVQLSLTVDSDGNTVYSCIIDGYSIRNNKEVSYRNSYLCSEKIRGFHFSDIKVYNSLGLTRLFLLAQIPVIPLYVNITSLTKAFKYDQFSNVINTSYLQSSTFLSPVDLTFTDVHNNNLGISIKDPYDYFDLNLGQCKKSKNMRTLMKQISEHQAKSSQSSDFRISLDEYKSVLLSKTVSMYNAVSLLALATTKVESLTYSDSTTYAEIVNSEPLSSSNESHVEIRDIKPFFFLDSSRCETFVENNYGYTMVFTKSMNM